MQYLLYIIIIPFIYFNYKIIVSDIKNKIIPNKYLGYLLLLIPFYYIYLFFSFTEINYLLFLGQIFLTLLISFILYYFGIWAAGDAKYLLTLSLFIPNIGIIPFIGNIALITIIYLFLYFIWFYFGKILFNKVYKKALWINIKKDLYETWETYKGNKGSNTYKIITKFLLIFVIIFVSIRLSRIYLFNSIIENGNNIILFKEILEKYNVYILFLAIGVFIGSLYLFKIYINKTKIYISEKLKLDFNLVGNIFISILFIILNTFIIYELINNYNEIISLLFKIFTLYLAIYLIFKILFYAYKITFGISEYKYIDIHDLKEGDIIDITFLKKIFSTRNPKNINSVKNMNQNQKYFLEIKNPIDKNTRNKIIKIYKKTNNICLNDLVIKKNFNLLKKIKILKTFPFSPYIILGFFISLIFKNSIFVYLSNLLIQIYNKSFLTF